MVLEIAHFRVLTTAPSTQKGCCSDPVWKNILYSGFSRGVRLCDHDDWDRRIKKIINPGIIQRIRRHDCKCKFRLLGELKLKFENPSES